VCGWEDLKGIMVLHTLTILFIPSSLYDMGKIYKTPYNVKEFLKISNEF